jgi:hypothetical protein
VFQLFDEESLADAIAEAIANTPGDYRPLLLATIVTASAALVAIIGGLLVARVVSLATEKSGLRHRADDLRAALQIEEGRRDEFEEHLHEWDAGTVLMKHYRLLADPQFEPDLDLLIEEADVDRTAEQIQPYLEQIRSELLRARENIEHLFADGYVRERFDDLVSRGDIRPTAGTRLIYKAAFEQLQSEKPRPKGRFAAIEAGIAGRPEVLRSVQDLADHRKVKGDAGEVAHKIRALDSQVEQAELALARVTDVAGVFPALGVLAWFSLVGTVVPLFILLDPEKMFGWTPGFAIFLYCTGLAAVFGYVIYEVQQLSREKRESKFKKSRKSRESRKSKKSKKAGKSEGSS